MKTSKGNVWVFDNQGETADRYTIVDSRTNVYGCSENPFHPMGIGQYCFTSSDTIERRLQYLNKKLTKTIIKSCLSDLIKNYRKKDSNIGIEVKKFDTLPTDVQKYILENILN